MSEKDEGLLEKAKRWFKLVTDAEAAQRRREQEDLLFQVAENQWTDAAKTERAGGPGRPARPMLSISLLHQPLQLVQNQAEAARLGITLHPVSENANDEDAEIKQGLIQRIERDGGADVARLWALDRAKQCGRGWYRIVTRYDEDSENPSDQEIGYERILYQEMVYADPASQKPDYSDARFIFVAAHIPFDTYRDQYPDADYYSAEDFNDLAESEPEWVRVNTDGTKDPLVVELFYKVPKKEEVSLEAKGGPYKRERERQIVRRAVISGCEVLEDDEWIGSYIPMIPVIGRELQPVKGERRWEGMVRPARDGQMTFNYAITSIVEDIGRLSKAPYIGAEGQFDGHETQWQEANIRNVPYLEYKLKTLDGTPIGPPTPMQIDGTKMQLSVALAQEAKGLVQAATAVHEPSLGEMSKRKDAQSGRAILALQQQADAGTSNYLQNLAKISIPYEARVILDLLPKVYDRPGRITRVLGGEDETQTVMLNAPFVMQGDMPVPAQAGDQNAKHYDLAKGKYAVSTTVGKSFQTRLEQGASEMGDILANAPELMPVIGDLYFKFRDFPGAKEISERLAKWREKQMPGLGEEKDGQQSPEAIAMRAQALEQQVQELTQQLQQAIQAIETDKAKQEATLQKAAMDNQTKLAVEQMKAKAEEREDAIKIALVKMEQLFEAVQNALDRAHEEKLATRQAAEQRAHEVGMAAGGAHTVTRKREDGQEQGAEQERESSQGQSRQPKEKKADA